jgi:hypothetical protein
MKDNPTMKTPGKAEATRIASAREALMLGRPKEVSK